MFWCYCIFCNCCFNVLIFFVFLQLLQCFWYYSQSPQDEIDGVSAFFSIILITSSILVSFLQVFFVKPDLAMIAATNVNQTQAAANVNQTQPTEAQKQKQKASIAKKPTNTVKATKESTQPPLKPTKPTSPAKAAKKKPTSKASKPMSPFATFWKHQTKSSNLLKDHGWPGLLHQKCLKKAIKARGRVSLEKNCLLTRKRMRKRKLEMIRPLQTMGIAKMRMRSNGFFGIFFRNSLMMVMVLCRWVSIFFAWRLFSVLAFTYFQWFGL